MALVVKNLPANAGDMRDVSLIPGLGRSPGGGYGNPLQYSCLENPHRGPLWATIHWVAKSQAWLKRLSMHERSFVKSFPTQQPHGLQHASPLSFPIYQSLLKFMSIESVIPHDPTIMLNIYPNKFKYYAHTKMLHKNVYSSFICNHQKPEATKMSFNRWIDTQNIIYWCQKFSLSVTQCWIKSQR